MISVTDRRMRLTRSRRPREVRLTATAAFVLSRALWRMYRGRAPWSRGRTFRR
jgi:hypothetical protein